jgi:hypothetical protein
MRQSFVLKYLILALLIFLGVLNKTSNENIVSHNNKDTLSGNHISYLIKTGRNFSGLK